MVVIGIVLVLLGTIMVSNVLVFIGGRWEATEDGFNDVIIMLNNGICNRNFYPFVQRGFMGSFSKTKTLNIQYKDEIKIALQYKKRYIFYFTFLFSDCVASFIY